MHSRPRFLIAVATSLAFGVVAAVPAAAAPADAVPQTVVRTAGTIQTVPLTDAAGRRTDAATAGLSSEAPGMALRSAPITTETFLVAALTWDADDDVAPGSEISFRVREEAGWSDWLDADADHGYDAAEESAGGTEPFVTGGATAVQVRVSGSPSGLPANLDLVLVSADVDGGAAPAVTAATAAVTSGGGRFSPVRLNPAAAALAPATHVSGDDWTALEESIVTRAEWGADEAWTDANWTPRFFPLQAAVVHHTAGTNSYTAEDSAGIVKAIFDYHTGSRGWGDIGYNYLVDQYGQTFEGRKFSLLHGVPGEVPQGWMIEAGHAAGYNKGTLGVAAMGDFSVANAPSSDLIVSSMAQVISWRFDLANLDPDAPSGLVAPSASSTSSDTYATGAPLPRILAHDDLAATLCPGSMYDRLDEIRAGVTTGYTRDLDTAPPQVTATPGGGIYPSGTPIALTADDVGASIFATIDYPDAEGGLVFYSPSWATDTDIPDTRYADPLVLTSDMTVTYVAVDAAGNTSAPVVQSYTVGKAVNNPPTADAGPDQAVDLNATVRLDGTGSSDPEGAPLQYVWTAPDEVILDDPTSPSPSFTATAVGTFVFTLEVSDGASTDTDTVNVLVTGPDNAPPSADAGSDQTVSKRSAVTLDGSGSSDPSGDPLTYLWTQTGGKTVTLDDPTAVTPTFTPKAPGDYTFELTVGDGALSGTDSVTVTVTR